jgi:peptidoglycan/LPS O-acetylase OafA/YrhL
MPRPHATQRGCQFWLFLLKKPLRLPRYDLRHIRIGQAARSIADRASFVVKVSQPSEAKGRQLHPTSQITPRGGGNGRIGPLDSRTENSYDFVRFCAASAVLFSHHFDLAGRPEPPVPGYGEDFGELAVEVFFCLSGFLICRSLQKSKGWARFVAARFLRIFPNLAFVLVATSAATFFWYGNFAHLWSHAEYVINNLMMFLRGMTYVIPGVFADTVRPAVNEPLWSLPYELWLYAVLALIFFAGRRWSGTGIVLGALLLGIAWTATPFLGEFEIEHLNSLDFFRLGSFFLSGAVLAVVWPYIGRHALVVGATD